MLYLNFIDFCCPEAMQIEAVQYTGSFYFQCCRVADDKVVNHVYYA